MMVIDVTRFAQTLLDTARMIDYKNCRSTCRSTATYMTPFDFAITIKLISL